MPAMPSFMGAADSFPWMLILAIIVLAAVVWFVVQTFWRTPRYHRMGEGFTASTGEIPSCLRTLPEATALLDGVKQAANRAEYREMTLLLSKMACLREDLESPAQTVHVTKTVAFETAHDRMAVAELCGMCFNRSVGLRDLDIVFETWRDRGEVLLRRLCTLADLSEAKVVELEGFFKATLERIYGVAKGRCLASLDAENPGDVRGVETAATRAYEGRASGWNGTV
jgi:hypothetical protein